MGRLGHPRHGGFSMQSFSVSLAPSQLTQAINPWTWNFSGAQFGGAQFGLFNIDLGQSSDPALERKILDDVGSYGRQIGQIGDALGVILRHIDLGALSPEDSRTIDLLKGQLAQVAQLKSERRAVPAASAA
jgi:hypothetical protein